MSTSPSPQPPPASERERHDYASGIDLAQFHQVFFEEAGENLERMEQLLLALDLAVGDDEALNAIFRCAHSVKGGAATFGFGDMAELTHQAETLLDRLRRHELAPTCEMIDVLLAAGDALRAQLARHRGAGGAEVDTRAVLDHLAALLAGRPGSAPRDAASPSHAPGTVQRVLELTVGPLERTTDADNLIELFREIEDLGRIEALDAGMAADGMRRFKLVTTSSDDELLDLFTFHVARDRVKLAPLGPGDGFHEGAPGAPPDAAADAGYGFFDNAPGAPSSTPPAPRRAVPADAPAAADSSTLRVSIEKVDQLINLVGELVITQAMLAEGGARLEGAAAQQLAAGLADLERNTRDLQQAVMSIRMIPMSVVFNRFPRLLRDLAGRLGKKVELRTEGEATELDKGLVEKIIDPLTHLVRNSCDHGLETPDERGARGKPETGTVTLIASHQGGSVMIEVRDDGRGLSRAKLLAKARERGIAAPDSLGDAEVWNLIYIVPLAAVVESFQANPATLRTIGNRAQVVEVRDAWMPVVDLERLFQVPRAEPLEGQPIMVVVEAEGGRAALVVDELLGQQQVVVKNLEANHRKVDDISGATILGDGRVALILDVASLVRRSRH